MLGRQRRAVCPGSVSDEALTVVEGVPGTGQWLWEWRPGGLWRPGRPGLVWREGSEEVALEPGEEKEELARHKEWTLGGHSRHGTPRYPPLRRKLRG